MAQMPWNSTSEKKNSCFLKVHRLTREVAKSHVKSCRPPASLALKIQCVGLNLMLNGLRDYWITERWLIIHTSVS